MNAEAKALNLYLDAETANVKHMDRLDEVNRAARAMLAAIRALTDWGREHTSPTQANSPHALLVAACAAIAQAEAAGITTEGN